MPIDLTKCPACGSALVVHQDQTDELTEWWGYECDAEVVKIDGKLEDNNHCREALETALRRMQQAA